jgi:hypothetical protein
MITNITDAQKAQIAGWVDKYIQVGLSTAPADRPRAERGIIAHYEAARLTPPKAIVWSGSPIVTALAAPASALIVENVKGDVREHVPAFVARFVTNEALRPEVTRVIREVLTAVALVGDDGEEALQRLNPASAVRNAWSRYSGGAWWCSFTAWATFIRDILDVSDIPVGPREDVDSSCGWWWAHHEFTVATERPCILTRDVQGRLHGETGPAISWPDGWCLHYWRGTRVPREWIENPSGLDPRVALGAREHRAPAMCGRDHRLAEGARPPAADDDRCGRPIRRSACSSKSILRVAVRGSSRCSAARGGPSSCRCRRR